MYLLSKCFGTSMLLMDAATANSESVYEADFCGVFLMIEQEIHALDAFWQEPINSAKPELPVIEQAWSIDTSANFPT